MKLSNLIRELDYHGGLYQVQVGDKLAVGQSGMLGKYYSTVKKIYPDGKVLDDIGNTFNPDGRLYKSSHPTFTKQWSGNKSKITSAKIVTQKEFDSEYKRIKVEFLQKYNWDKMSIDELESVINSLPIKQASKLQKSRFEK